MSEGRFDDAEIEFPSPKCGLRAKHTAGMACAACGAHVRPDTEEFRSGLNEFDKTMEDLRRTFL